jgi:ornithine--oxo-acid transaminase
LSLNGSEVFREDFGPLGDSAKVPFGDAERCSANSPGATWRPSSSSRCRARGCISRLKAIWPRQRRLCRQNGVLLVADEVQTGVGRTGKFLALHHEAGAEPDMVVMSKALSGGFVPVAAVLMRRPIYDKVFSSLDRAVVHSSTFGKSNFAMAAGLATLAVLDEEDLMANATAMGDGWATVCSSSRTATSSSTTCAGAG